MRIFHAVRSPQGPPSVERCCRAYRVRMHPTEFFSHQTAADLLGLPLPWRLRTDNVHVTTLSPRRAPRSAGVVGHRIAADLVQLWRCRGLTITSPVDTWCQLAQVLSIRELVVMGDALLRRHAPLSTLEELQTGVRRYAGRRGHRKLVVALAKVRPRTDSPPETELRLDIVADGLPEPEVNGVILDRFGRQIAIGDLVYRRYRVLVEYDGGQHREDLAQYERDIDRLDDVMREGWRVIRVNKSHRGVRRELILRNIRAALIERGWRPS